jgi:hypothetical protein
VGRVTTLSVLTETSSILDTQKLLLLCLSFQDRNRSTEDTEHHDTSDPTAADTRHQEMRLHDQVSAFQGPQHRSLSEVNREL